MRHSLSLYILASIFLFGLVLPNPFLLAQPDISTQWLEEEARISLDRGYPMGVVSLDDNLIAVGYQNFGLVLFDITDPSSPIEAGVFNIRNLLPNQGHITRLARHGNTLYIATEEGDLGIMDVSETSNPIWVGSLENLPCNTRLEVIGDYLVVSSSNYVYYNDECSHSEHIQNVLYLQEDTDPVSVYQQTTNEDYYRLRHKGCQYAIIDDRFFTISGYTPDEIEGVTYHSLSDASDSGFINLDMSRLQSPSQDEGWRYVELLSAYEQNLLFRTVSYDIEDPDSIYHFDISDPENPILVTSHQIPYEIASGGGDAENPWDMNIDQGLFLGWNAFGLYHPEDGDFEYLGAFPERYRHYQTVIQGNLLITASGEDYLSFWQIRTSSNPQLLASITSLDYPSYSDIVCLNTRTYALLSDDKRIISLTLDEDYMVTASNEYRLGGSRHSITSKIYSCDTTLFFLTDDSLVTMKLEENATLSLQANIKPEDLQVNHNSKFISIYPLQPDTVLALISIFNHQRSTYKLYLMTFDNITGEFESLHELNFDGNPFYYIFDKDHIYTLQENEYRIYSLEDPTTPSLLATYEYNGGLSCAISPISEDSFIVPNIGGQSYECIFLEMNQYRLEGNKMVESGLDIMDSGSCSSLPKVGLRQSYYTVFNTIQRQVWFIKDHPESSRYSTVSYGIRLGDDPVGGFFDGNLFVVATPCEIIIYRTDQMIQDVRSETTTIELPTRLSLNELWPNPFNGNATVSITLPEAGSASIDVFNVLGRQVACVSLGQLTSGRHLHGFNASELPSGAYFLRAKVNDQISDPMKAILLK